MLKNNKIFFPMILMFVVIFAYGCGSETEGTTEDDNEVSFPENDIEMVVGWGAGGGTDNFARAISNELSDNLDTNINVVNQPGSSGANAGNYVVNQPADGHTIWAISSNYPINVADDNTPHDLSQYTPVGRVQNDTMTLQVQPDKYEDFSDFVQSAEESPGSISIGGTGARSFDELVLRQFEQETGLEFNYIPYEDAGEMHAALLGDHIDAMLDEIGPTISQLEEGSLEMLLIFAEEEVEGFEDIPLSVDEGVDVVDGQSRGLLVHSDTPDEVVEILEEALEESKDGEEYLSYEESNYLHLRDGWLNSEDFTSKIEEDIQTNSEILSNMD